MVLVSVSEMTTVTVLSSVMVDLERVVGAVGEKMPEVLEKVIGSTELPEPVPEAVLKEMGEATLDDEELVEVVAAPYGGGGYAP